MPRINADIPTDLNKMLKVYALRYNFDLLPDALVDVLRKFFLNEDYSSFFEENKEIKKVKK